MCIRLGGLLLISVDIDNIIGPTITYMGNLSDALRTGKGKKRKSATVLSKNLSKYLVEVDDKLLVNPRTGRMYYDDRKPR